jgi:hypothetical protein
VALLARGMPSLDSLDEGFRAGASAAEESYALAFRAVADLAALDRERGLALPLPLLARVRALRRCRAPGVRRHRRAFERDVAVADAPTLRGTGPRRQPVARGQRLSDRVRAALDRAAPARSPPTRALRAADELADREARASGLAVILGEDVAALGPTGPIGPPGGAERT